MLLCVMLENTEVVEHVSLFCGFLEVIRLTTHIWEISHFAPTFEIGPSSELNKGGMGTLQREDEDLDKKEGVESGERV